MRRTFARCCPTRLPRKASPDRIADALDLPGRASDEHRGEVAGDDQRRCRWPGHALSRRRDSQAVDRAQIALARLGAGIDVDLELLPAQLVSSARHREKWPRDRAGVDHDVAGSLQSLDEIALTPAAGLGAAGGVGGRGVGGRGVGGRGVGGRGVGRGDDVRRVERRIVAVGVAPARREKGGSEQQCESVRVRLSGSTGP